MYSSLYNIFNNTKLKSIIIYHEKKYNIIINKYIDLEYKNIEIEDKLIKLENKNIKLKNKYAELENKNIELEDKYEKLINISFNYKEDDIRQYEDFYKITNNSFIYDEYGIVETGEYEPIFI